MVTPQEPALAHLLTTLHSAAPTHGSATLHGIKPGFLKSSWASFAPLGGEELGTLGSPFPAAA